MKSMNQQQIQVATTSTFPAFTVAALIMLVMKLTAYPALSWWWIGGVFFGPFLILVSVFILLLAFIVPVAIFGAILAAIRG